MRELSENLRMIQDQMDPNLYVTLLGMINTNNVDGIKNVIEAVLDVEYSSTLDWFYSILPGQTQAKVLHFNNLLK